MLDSVKRYELSDNANSDLLLKLGFKKLDRGGYTLYKSLYEEIDLFIDIKVLDGKICFDDYDDVSVIDEDFGQYYGPFYNDLDNEYVRNVILRYNAEMDRLVSNGLLKEKKEKVLVKIP